MYIIMQMHNFVPFFAAAILALSACSSSSSIGLDFIDARDNKEYKVAQIGSQTWMAENLNYAGEEGNLGRCYEDNDEYCKIYGRLYTLAEVICPDSWHLPSKEELDILLNYVDPSGSSAGVKLKATSGWEPGAGITAPKNPNGTDDFGFAALPGGFCGSSCAKDNFTNIGTMSYWWTTSVGTPVPLSITWNISSSTNSVADAMQSNSDSRFYARCLK